MNFYDLFLLELGDMFNAELQIIDALPKVIHAVASDDLVEALSHHLEETRNQVKRIKRIFHILGEKPHGIDCEAMRGILQEGEEVIQHIPRSSVRDAGLIGACQKVEHYEIAAYGTLYAHAKVLDFDREILNLIDDNLDEESAADEKLTSIAEGGFFTTGINKEAQKVTADY